MLELNVLSVNQTSNPKKTFLSSLNEIIFRVLKTFRFWIHLFIFWAFEAFSLLGRSKNSREV